MATRALNKNNSAVKRIMQEARELANDPCTDYSAAPLEDDIFEWHCTLRGPPGTEFEGGLYHFRILLPAEYPFRPPSIMMLTPNGRFELNTKLCISFTNCTYSLISGRAAKLVHEDHEELWQPAWGVRTAIIGLQGFFPLKGTAAVGVGALEFPVAERKRLAALSREWVCPTCSRSNLECLPDPPASSSASSSSSLASMSPAETGTTTPASADIHITSSDRPCPEPASQQAPSAHVPLVAPIPTRPSPPPPILTCRIATPPIQDTKPPPPSRAPSAPRGQTQPPTEAFTAACPRRPPVLLDTAICVLLVLMFALVAKRIF
ncbi:UBC-like protein [Wolfiporia cocos MD-104 SS10]|uniref:UBC-like protein n=1 Tax=Wolfiporia cocos (strain MD-104) TaxID=742152 RepID=A0A2H3JKS4_WOLCO|nr:UBC-like protein [Wolfiporia cocos MD-104 SS10]